MSVECAGVEREGLSAASGAVRTCCEADNEGREGEISGGGGGGGGGGGTRVCV